MSFLNKLVEWWPDYSASAPKKRYFEGAQPTDYHPLRGSSASGDALMQRAGTRIRNTVRYLDDNHDLMVGVFDDLVNNTVGHGVAVEPMVRLSNGSLADDTNKQLAELYETWGEYPEASESFGMETMERMIVRHWLRDGEMFYQLVGSSRFNYRTEIPFVLELIEADMVPFELTSSQPRVTHGIERNAWGAPVAFYVLKQNPGDTVHFESTLGDTRKIPAARVRQLKFVRRFNQARGVPIAHAVINRLRDIKDVEESERIACKVASSIALAIERDQSIHTVTDADTKTRQYEMAAGAIYDLLPGEKIETVGQSRPNEKLVEFREMMLRAVAAGTMTRKSSISRNFDGTYSAQRQELVEGSVGYRALFGYLRNRFYRPVWRRFVEQCFFSGLLVPQPGTDITTLYRADFRPPALPWIDPAKEAAAWEKLVKNKLESRAEIARQRGRDGRKLADELQAEQDSGLYDTAPFNPQENADTDADTDTDNGSADSEDQQQAAANA